MDLTESAGFLDALAAAAGLGKGGAAGSGTQQGGADTRAVDCGAGVGRITAGLLMQRFAAVDVVEPVHHFIAQARTDLGRLGHRGEFHQIGLEAFSAGANTYDCVWVQWVIGHLVDDDMVAFLQVCIPTPPAVPRPCLGLIA